MSESSDRINAKIIERINMFTNSNNVKTLLPQFHELNMEAEVVHHLRDTDFEYDPAKTAIAVWFDVSYNEVENLPGYEPGAMSGAWGAIIGIAIIASHRHEQSIKSAGNGAIANDPILRDKCLREAGFPKPIDIPKDANGRSKLPANSETFGDDKYIIIAGSRKNPCLFVFHDSETVFSTCEDNVQHMVLQAWTTRDNEIDGEQLLERHQELRDNRRAA